MRRLLRPRCPITRTCGSAELAATVAAFASVDEATKPIEASDKVSASNFFMLFPFSPKKIRTSHNHCRAFVTPTRESLS
jgi:hypothetical protein